MPSHLGEFQLHLCVTPTVSVNFRLPEIDVCARHHERFTTFVTMPETSIYENAGPIFPQYNIRFSWQTRMVQPVPETIVPQIFTHNNLRLGILSMYGCHAMMSLFWCQRVGHFFSFHRCKNIENKIMVSRFFILLQPYNQNKSFNSK